MHISIPLEHTVELLNFTPVNPLISKCQIKVCYVGENPNRNNSVITKEVATEMAKTLPGSPIVGFFNKEAGDFEEHNRMIDVSNGKFEIVDTTRPYGFVDLGAKVWFQKFLDDGVEHEYLVTEGYIWTGTYPESQRIIDKGNNHSMELHNELTKGSWTIDDNGMPKFFIINEAVIQKLCILGEQVEPCFEGASMSAHFALDDDFKTRLFSMMEELKTALQEGGTTQMNQENERLEEQEMLEPETEFKKKPDEEEEEEKNNPPADQKEEESKDPEEKENSEDDDDDEDKKKKKLNHAHEEENKDEEKCPDCGKPKSECTCDEDKKKNYSLEEIPEYVELAKQFALATAKVEALEQEIAPLREFKAKADLKEKQDMIASFYMLNDADKADVIANIDKYSVADIEAKLAIICVRNKVNFSLDDDNTNTAPIVYQLGNSDSADDVPAWIKAVRQTAESMK